MKGKNNFSHRAAVLFMALVLSTYGLPPAAANSSEEVTAVHEGVIAKALAQAGTPSASQTVYNNEITLSQDTVINGDLIVKK